MPTIDTVRIDSGVGSDRQNLLAGREEKLDLIHFIGVISKDKPCKCRPRYRADLEP